jgi:penicillin-binding protein 1A
MGGRKSERREPVFDVRSDRSEDRPAAPAPKPRKRSRGGGGRRRGPFTRLAYWGAVLSLWVVIGGIAALAAIIAYLPPIQSLEIPKRPPQIQMVDLYGKALASRGENYGAPVTLKTIPRYVPQAFIAIEDRRFHSHFGIDPIGIARAAVANVMRRGVAQGGSTLTQQLAKNLFLTQERTLKRKVQEAGLALWLEHKFTKTEILELYLNRVYFGAGAYGIEAASLRYFNKPARRLTLAESAVLAGLVRSPSRLAPNKNPNAAEKRAQLVLAAMVDMNFVTDEMAKIALMEPAQPVKAAGAGSVNYVADWIMDVLDDLIGRVEQDIVVETSIDPALQLAAEQSLIDELARGGAKSGVGQGAVVSMTPEGAVRAMVGGRNYAESQFNRAVAAKRQPGSAFKPFVYLTAVERGLTPDSVREDKAIAIKGWRPENYSREYYGPVTLQQALAYSLNTVSVRLTMEFGPPAVVRTAHRLGIASKLEPNASLALGTSEVSVIELTSAFATFANGGSAVAPHVVERVRTAAGKVLYTRKPENLGRIVEPRFTAMMNRMMQETLLTGTARKASLGAWPAAGKTGTSQEFRDAWFVGYTSHLVTAVWLGNDDSTPTKKVTGGGMPVDIWARFMKQAHQGVAPAPLPGLQGGVPMAQQRPLWNEAEGGVRPPEDVAQRTAAASQNGGGLDVWFLDRLFGRR